LGGLLTASLTGIALYSPIRGTDGTVVDFTIDLLNPAAQRILGQPARPSGTYLQHYPHTLETGVFAFHQQAFESGEPAQLEVNYQGDSLDNYFQLSAQRVGQGLLVSFTDTADQPRSPVETALRAAQAAEQAARAEAEAERATLRSTLEQAPVAIALLEGPAHVVTFANADMALLWGRPLGPLLNRAHFEALPDLAGQGFEAIFAEVYHTGRPYHLREQFVHIDRVGTGQLVPGYFHIVYQPLYAAQGGITGIIASATEVTEQVQARQQVQQLNEELAAINEELRARNEKYQLANTALVASQHQQRLLNQELEAFNQDLEARVTTRTQEAQQQRGRLEQLVMTAPLAICVFDGPEWVYQLVNPRYQQLFPGRELLGRRLVDALPELVDQPLLDILHRVYDTGVPFESQAVLVPLACTPAGPLEDIYFDLTYQARYDAAGRIDGFVTFATDVTAQVLARQLRETQQQQLRDLFEQVPVAIAIFRGPQHVIELANPAACALWDRTPQQSVGTPLFELVPEGAGQGFEQLLDGVMATGEPYVAHELPSLIDRHGQRETAYWSFVNQPLREGPGPITAVTSVAVDVTDQVRARQQVQQLNEALLATNRQLTRTNADLDNFVYTASHDLKAPISNIEGLLRLLENRLPPELRTHGGLLPVLARMHESVQRFTRTLGHLTEVSKLQQEFARPAAPTAVAPLLEDVRQDLQPLLAATGGQLRVDLTECPTLVLSEKNLRSILYNLVSNALKYHQPGRPPVVRISCRSEGPHRVLRVQDNGVGLDEEQQAKLFRLFQRLHTHVDGSGVGLYMVKKMVENAGGTLTVQSRPGDGSTFTAHFPA